MKYIVYISLFLILACNQAAEQSANLSLDESAGLMKSNELSESNNEKPEAPKVKRKLIKRGSLSFEVKNLEETSGKVKSLTKNYEGYLGKEETRTYGSRVEYSYMVRLPARHFDSFIADLSEGIDYFDEKNISVDDVTEQFLDVQARLKTKKALEVRYMELLNKARNVSEVLEIERELGKIRGDIESMEGRLKYLTDQVSFSTLNLTFYKKIGKESRFGSKFKDSLKTGWNILVGLVLGIVSLWPIVILLILGVWLMRKFWLKK